MRSSSLSQVPWRGVLTLCRATYRQKQLNSIWSVKNVKTSKSWLLQSTLKVGRSSALVGHKFDCHLQENERRCCAFYRYIPRGKRYRKKIRRLRIVLWGTPHLRGLQRSHLLPHANKNLALISRTWTTSTNHPECLPSFPGRKIWWSTVSKTAIRSTSTRTTQWPLTPTDNLKSHFHWSQHACRGSQSTLREPM